MASFGAALPWQRPGTASPSTAEVAAAATEAVAAAVDYFGPVAAAKNQSRLIASFPSLLLPPLN